MGSSNADMFSQGQSNSNQGEILLEAGTNEFEVLVFGLAGGTYGINVAKVREVILPVKLTQSPGQPDGVLGMFNIRGSVLPLVDLSDHLDLRSDSEKTSNGRIIIAEFNQQQIGFLVDSVDQIHRMSWGDVKQAPELDEKGECGSITGMIEMDNRLILLLDFESIADEIRLQDQLHVRFVENEYGVDRGSKYVILAEDSAFVRNLLQETFETSGYTNIKVCRDGAVAWQAILEAKKSGKTIDAIISDIEMPRIDGLYLTKRVKDDDDLRKIPVMLFSSLITADNLKKGKQVGADAQIAKPDLPGMVVLLDKLIAGIPIDEATPDEPFSKAA